MPGSQARVVNSIKCLEEQLEAKIGDEKEVEADIGDEEDLKGLIRPLRVI